VYHILYFNLIPSLPLKFKTIKVLVLEESEDISLDSLSPILDCLNKDNEVRVWKFNLIDYDYETGP
jgi:hypothetical protein